MIKLDFQRVISKAGYDRPRDRHIELPIAAGEPRIVLSWEGLAARQCDPFTILAVTPAEYATAMWAERHPCLVRWLRRVVR
jgi:hypothetical protein